MPCNVVTPARSIRDVIRLAGSLRHLSFHRNRARNIGDAIISIGRKLFLKGGLELLQLVRGHGPNGSDKPVGQLGLRGPIIAEVLERHFDFDWAAEVIKRYDLAKRCSVLMSPVFGDIKPPRLVEWVLSEKLPVRFQLQMHKFIWSPTEIGV